MLGQQVKLNPGTSGQFPEYRSCAIQKACDQRDCDWIDNADATGVIINVFSFVAVPTSTSLLGPTQIVQVTIHFQTGLGDSQYKTFDIARGTSIEVPACILNAKVNYPADPDGAIEQPPIVVSWTCGKGSISRASATSHVRHTTVFALAGTDTSEQTLITNFADYAVVESPATFDTAVLTQYDASGAIVAVNDVGKSDGIGAPLSSRAMYYTITNPNETDSTIAVSWRLI